MADMMLPWFTSALIGLVVVLIMTISVVMLHRTVRSEAATFRCPWANRLVTARFLADDRGSRIGVVSCTAFADPRVVACGRHCLAGADLADDLVGGGEARA